MPSRSKILIDAPSGRSDFAACSARRLYEPFRRLPAIPRIIMTFSLAFHAENLLENVYDLDQVVLVRHHLVDVLVGAGNLVQHAFVLAADHAFGLLLEIRDRELLCRLVATHAPSGAVGAGVEALRRAAPAHYVAARAHAARDDAELARARPDRAL